MGWIDERKIVTESLTAMKRGGKLAGDFRCDGMSGIPDPESK